MLHNTFKFHVGGGLESADIGVLVRGVKNENFPCPARLRALNLHARFLRGEPNRFTRKNPSLNKPRPIPKVFLAQVAPKVACKIFAWTNAENFACKLSSRRLSTGFALVPNRESFS